jgi:hypothetical protein
LLLDKKDSFSARLGRRKDERARTEFRPRPDGVENSVDHPGDPVRRVFSHFARGSAPRALRRLCRIGPSAKGVKAT